MSAEPFVISDEAVRLIAELNVVDAADSALTTDERNRAFDAALEINDSYARALFLGLVDVLVHQVAEAGGVEPADVIAAMRQRYTEPDGEDT